MLLAMNGIIDYFHIIAGVSYTACYFELSTLWCNTSIFLQNTNPFLVLEWSMQFAKWFSEFAAICAVICLCLDLILTLKNPFNAASSRVKYYIAFSLLVPLFGVTFNLVSTPHSYPPIIRLIKLVNGECTDADPQCNNQVALNHDILCLFLL